MDGTVRRFALAIVIAAVAAEEDSTIGVARHILPGQPAAADSVQLFARFLRGRWHCRGGTPAGRTLAADVTFELTLGDQFLASQHVDVAPGRYQSYSLWPVRPNASAEAISTIYDNFGGARRFEGAWAPDSMVWTRDTSVVGSVLERFT